MTSFWINIGNIYCMFSIANKMTSVDTLNKGHVTAASCEFVLFSDCGIP